MTQVESNPPRQRPPTDHPAFVLLVENEATSRRIPLEQPRLLVGRGNDCDIVIDDPTVSRHHLVLELAEGEVHFRDLGGTNAALLDGRPLTAGRLLPGIPLLIGLTRLSLERAAAPATPRSLDHGDRTSLVIRSPTAATPPVDREALLDALWRPPLVGPDLVAELARHLLEAALALTGRTRGAIVRFEPETALRVIASVPTEPAGFTLPARLREPLPEPLCIGPWPAEPAGGERLIVPLAPHLEGALVLGAPRADAMPSAAALRVVAAFGRQVAVALREVEQRAAERQELERLRSSRSFPARAVRASSRLHLLRRRIAEAALAAEPLLLLGEEGGEAEELAIYHHEHGPWADGPLIRCYARLLPGHRIAQELGPVDAIREGAATCTVRARGGTLFVDSPEVLRPELQRRLAAVLDAGLWSASGPQFCAVVSLLQEGDGAMPALEPELRAVLDRFVPATVPPLRSYPQDVPRLCEVILDDAGPTASGVPRRLTEAAERALTAYHWPGNIRQLCRVVEAAAARAGDQPIAVDHLPAEVREPTASAIPVPTLREVEREHILRVLALCGDNKTKAARKLDISPSTLHEKLKRYEFDS